MTATSRVAFKLHRWLAWGVGLQVVLWVVGGLVFSLLPFHPWVKGGDVLKRLQPVLAAGWQRPARAGRSRPLRLPPGGVMRLHIMDYGGGEDFNHWLIRVAAVLTGLLVAAGAVLSVLALRRRWRRRHV